MVEGATLFPRLRAGLQKTQQALREKAAALFGSGPLHPTTLEELEEALIQADAGVAVAAAMLEALRHRRRTGGLPDAAAARAALREEIATRLTIPEGAPRAAATP